MQYFRLLSFMILVAPFVISLPYPTGAKFDRNRRGLDSRASRSEQNVKDTTLLSEKSSMNGIDRLNAQQSTSREMNAIRKRSIVGMSSNGLAINKMNTPAEQKRSVQSIGEIVQNDFQQSSGQMAEMDDQFLPKRSFDPTGPTPQDMVRELSVFSRVAERSMNMKDQQGSSSTINENDMRFESYHGSSQDEESFL